MERAYNVCGIFGYMNYSDRVSEADLVKIYDHFASVCIVRGSHAGGLAYIDEKGLQIQKAGCDLVQANFAYKPDAKNLMTHCRLALQGGQENNENNHPFHGQTGDGTTYALQHNGILANLNEVRKRLNLPSTDITTDSYAAVQILNTMPQMDTKSLKEMCEQLNGSYTFTILDENENFYICRGDVPFYMVHFKELKLYVYMSTRDLFEKAIEGTILHNIYLTSNLDVKDSDAYIVSLGKGDIVKITPDGNLCRDNFTFDDASALAHNWYMHGEPVESAKLTAQLKNLNNT
ncbi:MAG: hypothetical protein LBN22_10260 [Clostridiales Family XIII bacterium]|jgi:glutamine phosphoribosylpyrophosphate amidotransferase|nr:hypothetical protein [Clostridiales Family XIII bacterium]